MEKPESRDDDLHRRVRAGDEAAFAQIYRRWQGPLYRFALRMSGQPMLAEDVVHEVFMTLIRGGDGYDPTRGTLGAYLYGVARHKVLRRLEHERPYVALAEEDDAGDGDEAGTGPDPLAELTRQERIARVQVAVRSLPTLYREVVVLCDLQAQSYEDAARIVGCSVGTVRSRLHRARRLLAGKLEAVQAVGLRAAGGRR
jgi:RNA polymerase sigma-70 factor (ECF subfamily)